MVYEESIIELNDHLQSLVKEKEAEVYQADLAEKIEETNNDD